MFVCLGCAVILSELMFYCALLDLCCLNCFVYRWMLLVLLIVGDCLCI